MHGLKHRFQKLADYYGLSIRKLEIEFSLQRGNISNIGGAIGSDKLSKIHDKHPEINLVWLATGKGDMILKESPNNTTIIEPNNPVINLLLDRIEKLAYENKKLKEELTKENQQKKYNKLIEPDIAAEPKLKDNNSGKNE